MCISFYVLYSSNKNAKHVTMATRCKGMYSLMKLPTHNAILQTVPDAMHTIKDVIVNIHDLVTGKDDTVNCRKCEMNVGNRFGITPESLLQKINRKEPCVPYSLSSSEIRMADKRAEAIVTPAHVDFVPHNIFSRPANLKSHSWKQVRS